MGEQHPVDQSKQLQDQSKLLRRRARKLKRASEERIKSVHHTWHKIAVGRVCSICMLAQADGEFDEGVPCKAG